MVYGPFTDYRCAVADATRHCKCHTYFPRENEYTGGVFCHILWVVAGAPGRDGVLAKRFEVVDCGLGPRRETLANMIAKITEADVG